MASVKLKQEDVEAENPITILEIDENIRRIELGEVLTRPLKQLLENEYFFREYKKVDMKLQGLKECPTCKKDIKKEKSFCSKECRELMRKASKKYYWKDKKPKYKLRLQEQNKVGSLLVTPLSASNS